MRYSGVHKESESASWLGGDARAIGNALRVFVSGMITVCLAGCNSSLTNTGNSGQAQNPVQTYLTGAVGNLQTYAIDHTQNTFVVTSYNFIGGSSNGGTVQDSGNISQLASGIYDLDITYYDPGQMLILSAPPLTGSWLIEMPGEAGFTELEATNPFGTVTSFAPLAPTDSCPSISPSQTFQFVTIPKSLSTKSVLVPNAWNPQMETAYGSVTVATSGSNVQFGSISQFTLPSTNGGTPGAPTTQYASSVTAACSPTFFGQTVSYPTSGTVVNPGSNGSQADPPVATIAISPSGFLVEDAGSPSGPSGSFPPYENLLGAAYGAIGLPEPASALTTSNVVAAQYQGILYGAASGSSASISSPGFRLIGSFGFSNLQASCPTLPAPTTSTIIYGGEFANNDPSANTFGNCDLAIDLGTQDSSNNGLYSAATVWVSAAFPYNSTGATYSFPAVAIAGQINGKYAIFLIGVDTTGSPAQPWGIYLLQSN
jgi:hypothetical protein